MSYEEKLEVTTECPKCHKPYRRMMYKGAIIPGCALEICEECLKGMTDEHGNVIITLTATYEPSK